MAQGNEAGLSPAECRARAQDLMRQSDKTDDLEDKGRLLREALAWLQRSAKVTTPRP